MTQNSCDINCCCDQDCSSAEISAFEGCTSTTGLSDSVTYCDSGLVKVNNAPGVTRKSNEATCIMFNNNPLKGFYFADPGVVPNDATFSDQISRVKYAPEPLLRDNVVVSGQYESGIPVQAMYGNIRGALILPSALGSGLCDDFEPMGFFKNIRSSCMRLVASLTSACDARTVLDPSTYLEQVEVLSSPGSATTVQMTFRNVYCYDAAEGNLGCCEPGGILTPCSTGQYDFGTGISNTSQLTFPTPILDSGVCYNVLKELNYTVIYARQGSNVIISQVLVDFVYDATSTTSVLQTFQASFRNAATLTSTVYSVSGSPGYKVGLPVLAGTLTVSGASQAINWIPNAQFGITLPATRPDTGACTGSSAGDREFRVPVTYGENIVAGCALRYTFSQLNNDCDAIRQAIFRYQIGSTNLNVTHVGKFGNSDVHDISAWIPIGQRTPPATLTGDQPSSGSGGNGLCNNLLTEFNVQFLTVPLGSKANPQYAIVGARYQYVSGSFSFRCGATNCNSQSNVTQLFPIRSTVTFVRVNNQGYQYAPGKGSEVEFDSELLYPMIYRRLTGDGERVQPSLIAFSPFFLLLILLCLD